MEVAPSTLLTSREPVGVAVPLCLKLASGPQAGRLVRLTAVKCTLGSGPQCTLRLKAAGIQPVHCVIDRTGPRVVVRSIAGQSWLNGVTLEQAAVSPGSRLR